MTKPLSLPLICQPSAARSDTLAVQVYRDLLDAVRAGRLSHGSRLPSSRGAAQALGLSRSTINLAYELLRAEGVIDVRQGAAPQVIAPDAGPAKPPVKVARTPSARGQTAGRGPAGQRDGTGVRADGARRAERGVVSRG